MEKKLSLAHRIAGVVMLISSLFIAVYGICIGRWDALIIAVVWYFLGGGLIMQQISDIQAAFRDFKEDGVGDDVSESEYEKHR